MSRHLGRVAASTSGVLGWKPLRGRPPERVAKPSSLGALAVPVLLAVQGLTHLGDGGWFAVLGPLMVVVSIEVIGRIDVDAGAVAGAAWALTDTGARIRLADADAGAVTVG